MKIGVVCFGLSFVAGGARLIFGLARSLEKAGHTVIIYAPDFDAEHYKAAAAGLDIRVVAPARPLIWTGHPRNLFEWVKRKIKQEQRFIAVSKQIANAMEPDLDILNIHDFAYRTGYFYKKRNPHAQIIWTENAAPYMYVPKKNIIFDTLGRTYQALKEFSSRRYFRAIDKVAVLDFFNERWSSERGLRNISIIRCGVDYDKFYAPVKDFSEKAAKKSVKLFALGALNAYRRYDIVVRAVKKLRDDGVDARALIICNNIWDEGGVRDSLVALAQELGIANFIEFKFQGVPEEELRAAYRTSDFFVQAVFVPPPGNHGWGIVNFEGMSAGLPLIVAARATATEVLHDGQDAFFVGTPDTAPTPEDIAERVERCIADPALYRRIAEAGQAVAKAMTWEKYGEETLALFEK